MFFDACDLDFDLMTLAVKLGLDITVTYWYTEKQESRRANGTAISTTVLHLN